MRHEALKARRTLRLLLATRVTGRNHVRVSLPGRTASVREALSAITAELAEAGIHDADCASLEIVLAEVLNNIVEHAFSRCTPGLITVEVRPASDRLVCRVEDDGAPMPRGSLPEGRPPTVGDEVNDLPEGGFGWLLIRQITRDLKYRRRAGLNCLRFELPLAKGRQRSS